MNINLCTDAPKHNLALMKISAWHKANGDHVWLNGVGCFDLTYGSWLYTFSDKAPCNIEGGPGIDISAKLDDVFFPCSIMHRYGNAPRIDTMKPDYSLYGLDYSLGYTWTWCPRKCPFCIVPKQHNPKTHHSIWDFHDPKFSKICLMNNNTFSDPKWEETFEEIWEANLSVIDENGYDLRLLDDEKANALHKTKWETPLHFAWDNMEDETQVTTGLKLLEKT